MKIFFACVFLVITLLGLWAQAGNTCVEASLPRQTRCVTSSSPNLEKKACFLENDLKGSDAESSDRHGDSSTCRNCHLGHCAFTLSIFVQTVRPNSGKVLGFAVASVVHYDFQSNLFRPPIILT